MSKVILIFRCVAETIGWLMMTYGLILFLLLALAMNDLPSSVRLIPSPLASHVMEMLTCRTESFKAHESAKTCEPLRGWLGFTTSIWYLTVHYLLLQDDTHFAKQFTERKFADLKCGMDMASVKLQLGEPLRLSTYEGEESWHYTESPQDKNYSKRTVTFDQSGKLIHKNSDYYND